MKSSWRLYGCENCAGDVDFTLNLKSKVTVANNDLSIQDFLKTTKQDDGFYISPGYLQQVLVGSGFYSNPFNLDLEFLEQVIILAKEFV